MDWRLARSSRVLKLLADGTPRRAADLARELNVTRHHMSTVLRELHADQLIRISGWQRNAQVFILADGQPDADRPIPVEPKGKIERIVRKAEQEAGIAPGTDPVFAMKVEVQAKHADELAAHHQALAAGVHPDPLMRAIYA